MAIKGPELEIGIKANVDQVKTDLGTLATTLERIKKASDLRIDLDVPRQAKEKIAKLVNDIKKETQDISSIPLKFTEEGADALIAKLESTAGKLDTVIQKVALVNQHAKDAIENIGVAGEAKKIKDNAEAVKKLTKEVEALEDIKSKEILSSLNLNEFTKSATEMVNLIEKLTGMVKTIKKSTKSLGDTKVDLQVSEEVEKENKKLKTATNEREKIASDIKRATENIANTNIKPGTSPVVEAVKKENDKLNVVAKERERILKALNAGDLFDKLDSGLKLAGKFNLEKLNDGPEMQTKMANKYVELMSNSFPDAEKLLKLVADKNVSVSPEQLDRINKVVTSLRRASKNGDGIWDIVGESESFDPKLSDKILDLNDKAVTFANALEKAGAEAVKRQLTINQTTKATTEAKKEEQSVAEKVVEATKVENKAQKEVAKAVKETAKEKQVASAKATESTTAEIGLQKELAKAIKDVASQQKKLAETIKSNTPVEKPAQNVVVQVQQENNEIQAALAKREALLRRLNDTSRITSKRTYDRRMETLGGLNKTLNTAGYEELLPRFNRTTYGDDYYKEYVKEMSGYNAMQKEMNSLIERGIAPTRERWQAEKNRYDNMIAMLKAGKVISTKDFIDPTAGSYENFLGKIKEHQGAVSGISLNLTQFNEQVGTVIAKLEQMKAKGNIPVHLDTTGLKDALNNLNINVDSTAFHKKIAELRKSIDKLEPFKLAINADATQFNSVVDNCLKKLKELRDTNVTIIAQTKEVAKGSNGTPKKEAKEKSKKEIDYDKVLAMLKANPNTNGIVKGNSTVGARLSKVKILQSAAMLEGGWKPSADDLAWLANERNALERKNEAVKLNNIRPGTNLIDEYIRLREQESRAFREQLERQMNEEAKANRARLDANNAQLRENLKEWSKNKNAIAKAEEKARKRRLAQEAQATKEQKEYSDRTAKLMTQETNRLQALKDKLAKLQNDITISQLSGKKIAMDSWLRKSDKEAELINSIMSMGGTASAKYNGIAGFKEYVKPWNQQDKLKTDNKELKEALKTYERIEAILVRIRKTGIVPDNIDKLKQKELEARSIIQKSFGGALGSPAQQAAFNANYPQVLTQQNIDAAKSGAEISKRLKGEMRSAMSEFRSLIKEVRRDAINGTGRSEYYLANRSSRIAEILQGFDKNTRNALWMRYENDIHRAYANPADINAKAIAEVEKRLTERWQKFDMLDNVTPKAYTNMYQYLVRAAEKIGSMGKIYDGRTLTKTPEEYKASYVPPSSGLDESARKQQKIRDIAFAYSQELARQNQLIQSGVEIKQKDIEASERRVAKLKRDWEQTGATQELRTAPLVGRDAQEVNRARAVNNAMAWQNSYYSTASSKVSSLTSSLERLYTELSRNPGNAGIKQYINQTSAELVKARKEAKEVAKQMQILQEASFKGWRHKLRWVGGAFGFYESYDFLARFGETITKVDEAMKNLETVMPSIHKNRQALEDEQTKLINVASRYGSVTEEIVESARLWGRMYKDQNTVNALTEQTAKLAIADNFSIEESTKAVEAAMFQFGMQAKSTAEAIAYSNNIIDVYTKLSHNAGVSAQDLAAGVERSGAVAHQAGMDFEFLTALVAQGTRATALSGLTNNSPFMLETA